MRTPRFVVYVAAAVTAAFPLVLAPGGAIAPPSFAHWSQRSLVLGDRTGDAGWREATRRAVGTWNAVGSNLTIAWADGGDGCEAAGVTIPVCSDALPHGWKGATAFFQTADGHLVELASASPPTAGSPRLSAT